MTIAIAGSKSSKYIKDPINGVSDSTDSLTYQSVQNLWDARGAADVLIHALYATTALPFQIESGSVRRLIKITGHGAAVGDFLRMDSGSAESEEVAIIKIVDADFFVISKEINAAIGDDCFVMKPVTPTYNKDGSLNVSNGPVQFIRDAIDQQVIEDTTNPANNIGLPVHVVNEGESSRLISETLFFDYTGVSDAGYTQLIASTVDKIKSMTWFESSGQPMVVALGGVGSEVDKFVVPPGGFNGEIPMDIPAGSRVSIKQLNAEVLSSGIMIVANFYK